MRPTTVRIWSLFLALLIVAGAAGAVAAQAGGNRIAIPLVYKNYDVVENHPFGVQTYGPLDDAAINHAQVREARVKWIRWEAAWRDVEPVRTDPPTYNWHMDATLAEARRLGLNVVVTIVSSPNWAAMKAEDGTPYINGPIEAEDLPAFAQFVAAMAARYPWVTRYEFFNEPDNGDELGARYGGPYWGNFGAQYAAMLRQVYPALKAANPAAEVVLGGVAYDWFSDLPEQPGPFVRSFLEDVLAAGGGDYFDVLAFHYYPFFANRWEPYGPGILGKVNYMRDVLARYGVSKPMICTEVGEGSAPSGACPNCSQGYQARLLAQTFVRSAAADLDTVIWWMWKDLPDPSIGTSGLITTDLQPKASVQAFRNATLRLGRATYEGVADLGAGVEAYRFAGPAGALYAAWTTDGQARTVRIPAARATVTDLYGQVIGTLADADDGAADGHVSVNVAADPVYVEAV